MTEREWQPGDTAYLDGRPVEIIRKVLRNSYRIKVQVGDTMFAGWPVLSIPDLTDMRVQALLPDVDDGTLHVGMKAAALEGTRDEEVGFPVAGWFSYQPIWQDILAANPDLLD